MPDCLICAKFPSLKWAHISLWLNSKFQIPNHLKHPLPATDSSQTARTPLYPPVQAVPPYPPLIFQSRRPVPVPMTGVCYNSLLWMCMLNTLTWPDKNGQILNYNSSEHNLQLHLVWHHTQIKTLRLNINSWEYHCVSS